MKKYRFTGTASLPGLTPYIEETDRYERILSPMSSAKMVGDNIKVEQLNGDKWDDVTDSWIKEWSIVAKSPWVKK